MLYLTFDPVWTADSGNHFSHFVSDPWAHLICDTEEFCSQKDQAGAGDDLTREFRLGLNRKPASIYRNDFPKELKALGVTNLHIDEWRGCIREEYLNLRIGLRLLKNWGVLQTTC